MPLDDTISTGQSGHITDHQTIAAILNDPTTSSAFTGAFASRLAGAVNLDDYATLNGTTDDSAAVEAAVAASSGLVFVPVGSGLCRVTRALTFTKNVLFFGVDKELSGFLCDNASAGTFIFDGSTYAVQFHNMKVRGGSCSGVKVGAGCSRRTIFANCHVHNFTTAVLVSNAMQVVVGDEQTYVHNCDTNIKIDDSVGATTTVFFYGESAIATTQGVLISGNVTNVRFPGAIFEGSAGPEVQITATATSEPTLIVFDKVWFETSGTPNYAVVTTLNGAKRCKSVQFRSCSFGGGYVLGGVNAAGSDGMIFDGCLDAMASAGLYVSTGATNFHDLDAERAVLGTSGPLTAYADVSVFALSTAFGAPTNSRVPIAISQQPTLPGRTLQVRMRYALNGCTAADAITAEWTDDSGINPFGVTNYSAAGGDEWLTTDWANAPSSTAGWWPTIKNATAARGSVRRVYVDFRYV